jgi:hypothetical protein
VPARESPAIAVPQRFASSSFLSPRAVKFSPPNRLDRPNHRKTANQKQKTHQPFVLSAVGRKTIKLELASYVFLPSPPMPEDTRAQHPQQHSARDIPAMASNLIDLSLQGF